MKRKKATPTDKQLQHQNYWKMLGMCTSLEVLQNSQHVSCSDVHQYITLALNNLRQACLLQKGNSA